MAHRYVSWGGAGTREERTMGLLDVLNGMQQGRRGPSNPSAQSSGGMSPLTMAILGLLAWKAVKHFSGSQANASPAPAPGTTAGGAMGGGLGDVLKGGLGGLLAGGAAGSVISGGARALSREIQPDGPGETPPSPQRPGPTHRLLTPELAPPRA